MIELNQEEKSKERTKKRMTAKQNLTGEIMKVYFNGKIDRKKIDYNDSCWADSGDIEEYKSIYCFKENKAENNYMRGPLFFDLDGNLRTRAGYKDLKRQIRTLYNLFSKWDLEKEEVELYFSGAKGFHFIIPAKVFGIGFKQNLNSVNRQLALALKENYGICSLDTSIYDKSRLLRMPGSINYKSGLYKIPLSYEEFDKISLKELKNKAAEQPKNLVSKKHKINRSFSSKLREYIEKVNVNFRLQAEEAKRKRSSSFSPKTVLPCIKNTLYSDCPKGKRNRIAFLIISCLLQAKRGHQEIENALCSWNKQLTCPLKKSELENIMKNAILNDSKGKNFYGCGIMKDEGLCVKSCLLLNKTEKPVVA